MFSSDLQPILQDIAYYLAELHQTLLEEYEAFSHGDTLAMQQAGDTEYRLNEIIDDLKLEQLNLLEDAGLKQDQNAMLSYLRLQLESDQQTLQGLWQRIVKLDYHCQRLNKINSLIIKNHRYHTESTTRKPQDHLPKTVTQSARLTTVYDPSSSFQAIA
jgi:flagellar biosynthesis/type III secretory pathway chaperone